ncbi:putative bifunctional diguanylate cyclase/phosphodiesterase [Thermosulfurimonas dismutans]|uniref:Diguanylate cyclase/phosphodiesterase (GGDEF & EAL domains) with PAS/PAC sensor(S) n=1 Tax=Thermosulfurimonas dismutans TaxID=999894 RepID=A0A179D5B5_9BACT|nr:bifunctional diguanylate cyclase/phosphodiesterase [Thermosulfurimonas dismutans]OAQ21290.1 diguanylate cyclase/phosphodiesterase (GGDEF & EAL domains) with PAS/PAC sensor(s) [Thermosulfurimonas dismutans]
MSFLRRRFSIFLLSMSLLIAVAMATASYLFLRSLDYTPSSLWAVLFFNAFLSLLGLGGGVFFLDHRFTRALRTLEEGVHDVNRLEDLTQARFAEIDSGFEDLNRIQREILELVEKVKQIAVDKEVLEFELQLAERLVLTPQVLQDWPFFLRQLLKKLQLIFDFAYFFVAFKEEKDCKVHVFKCCPALEVYRQEIESMISEILQNEISPEKGDLALTFVHENLFEKEVSQTNIGPKEISQMCKVVMLQNPGLVGGVGVGVRSQELENEAKVLSLESLLTTLLNLVTSVKAIEAYTRDLEYYANRDFLTGLYNRRVFRELLEAEVERALRHHYKFAVLFIDLDNFKLINEAYGHKFGDEFLASLANFIQKNLRKEDILARYGGDEFVAILPYTDDREACTIARKLLERLHRVSFKTPDGKDLQASCSVGVAVYPDHAQNGAALVALADKAVYRVKGLGKNKVGLPEPGDLVQLLENRERQHLSLLEALEKQMVIPFFQPIFNLEKKKIEAYEVLMRIQDEEGKVFPAVKFISTAERTGLITQLEMILWEKALSKASETAGDFLLFFNLSPWTLLRSEFLERLKELLERYRFPPERIVIELTERESVKNLEELKSAVLKLKSRGMRLALDDFGSGFSSYRYLKDLPINFVKIEGEFVRSMRVQEIDRAFVASAATMAKLLNIKIVAECVEEASLLEELRKLGVHYAQGYYIGKPAPELRGQIH